jgi:hypothetical protein
LMDVIHKAFRFLFTDELGQYLLDLLGTHYASYVLDTNVLLRDISWTLKKAARLFTDPGRSGGCSSFVCLNPGSRGSSEKDTCRRRLVQDGPGGGLPSFFPRTKIWLRSARLLFLQPRLPVPIETMPSGNGATRLMPSIRESAPRRSSTCCCDGWPWAWL